MNSDYEICPDCGAKMKCKRNDLAETKECKCYKCGYEDVVYDNGREI